MPKELCRIGCDYPIRLIQWSKTHSDPENHLLFATSLLQQQHNYFQVYYLVECNVVISHQFQEECVRKGIQVSDTHTDNKNGYNCLQHNIWKGSFGYFFNGVDNHSCVISRDEFLWIDNSLSLCILMNEIKLQSINCRE